MPTPPYPPPTLPPYIPCPIIKAGLSSHLTGLVARWDAMGLRALQGFEKLGAIKGHWCGSTAPGAEYCCSKATEALANAQGWLADGQRYVTGDPPARGVSQLTQGLIDAIDCDAHPWAIDLAVKQVLAAFGHFEAWLEQRDQELGSMEAFWAQISGQCLVPVVNENEPALPAGPQ